MTSSRCSTPRLTARTKLCFTDAQPQKWKTKVGRKHVLRLWTMAEGNWRNKSWRKLTITISLYSCRSNSVHFFVNVMVDDPNKCIFREPNNTTKKLDRQITSSSLPRGKNVGTPPSLRERHLSPYTADRHKHNPKGYCRLGLEDFRGPKKKRL